MKSGALAEKRLSLMTISGDKPTKLCEVVKSDIITVLKNYFVFNNEDVFIRVDGEPEGVCVKIMANCEGIKPLNYL